MCSTSLHDGSYASPLFYSSPALRKTSSISAGFGPPTQSITDLDRWQEECEGLRASILGRRSLLRKASFLGLDDEERNAVFWRTADKELAAQNKELVALKPGGLCLQV